MARIDLVKRLTRSATGKLKETDTRVEAAQEIINLRAHASFLTTALVSSASDTAVLAALLRLALVHLPPSELTTQINKELRKLRLVPDNNTPNRTPAHVQLVPDSKRFCQTCRISRDIEGGKWEVASNGRTRRWLCGSCLQRRAERLAGGPQA